MVYVQVLSLRERKFSKVEYVGTSLKVVILSSHFFMRVSEGCGPHSFSGVLVLFLFHPVQTYLLFLPERAFFHTNPLTFSYAGSITVVCKTLVWVRYILHTVTNVQLATVPALAEAE